jgi:hypothetical protein
MALDTVAELLTIDESRRVYHEEFNWCMLGLLIFERLRIIPGTPYLALYKCCLLLHLHSKLNFILGWRYKSQVGVSS